jgi:hypothetical protein
MAGMDWLTYANQGATRNDPLAPELVNALGSFLPGMGVRMEVFSGGQEAAGEGGSRTGSTRHDHGNAADVFFYDAATGRQLDWANPSDRPVFEQIVSRGRAAGITGFGAGEGYMRPGSMHLGFGAPAVWGAGGQGANAADWLSAAYNGTPAPDPSIGGAFPSAGGPAAHPAVAGAFTPPPMDGSFPNALAGAGYGMDPALMASLAQGQNALAQAVLGLQAQAPEAQRWSPTTASTGGPVAPPTFASYEPSVPLYGFAPGVNPFTGA